MFDHLASATRHAAERSLSSVALPVHFVLLVILGLVAVPVANSHTRTDATTSTATVLEQPALHPSLPEADQSQAATGRHRAERIATTAPQDTALAVSRTRFASNSARRVVLARDDEWADALGASSLTGNAPLILTPARSALPADIREEINRVLPEDGGEVLVIGGTQAISQDAENRLQRDGHATVRLAGADRYTTAIAIADFVREEGTTAPMVLIVRGQNNPQNPTAGFSDALAIGGVAARDRIPVLVSPTQTADRRVQSWLDRNARDRRIGVGNTQSLSEDVLRAYGAERLTGKTRADTARFVLDELWDRNGDDGIDAGIVLINGYVNDSWSYGLSAAGLSADGAGPIQLTPGDVLAAETAEVLRRCRRSSSTIVIIGSRNVIADDVVQNAVSQAATGCDNSERAAADTGGADSYVFKEVRDGAPTKYDGCVPVRFVYNPDGELATTRDALERALRRASTSTGHTITLVGRTSERVDSETAQRESYVEDDGDGFRPILVNWPRNWSADDQALAYGGSATITDRDGDRRYVSGIINLGPTTNSQALLDAVVLHEVGHVLGLTHPGDDRQVMFARVGPSRNEYQSGDRAGLDRLGPEPDCTQREDDNDADDNGPGLPSTDIPVQAPAISAARIIEIPAGAPTHDRIGPETVSFDYRTNPLQNECAPTVAGTHAHKAPADVRFGFTALSPFGVPVSRTSPRTGCHVTWGTPCCSPRGGTVARTSTR